MYNKRVIKQLAVTALSLTTTLGLARARPSSRQLPAQNSWAEEILRGDAY